MTFSFSGRDAALRLLRRQIHDKLFTAHGKRNNKLEVLAEITRLRRFCCHPKMVFPDAASESAKIQTFLELVEELRGKPAPRPSVQSVRGLLGTRT
jgi:SNF2 family DNA or RNA helicase